MSIKKWGGTFPLLLFLVMVNTVGSEEINPPSALIQMESWAPYYRPFKAEIEWHTTILWNNPTASTHTVRHDGCVQKGPCLFDSGAVLPNGSFMIQGLAPGRYPYHCELHPIMRGELIIGASPFESPGEGEQVAQHQPAVK